MSSPPGTNDRLCDVFRARTGRARTGTVFVRSFRRPVTGLRGSPVHAPLRRRGVLPCGHHERRSVAVGNLHPSGFRTIVPKTLATAAIDRLLHHA